MHEVFDSTATHKLLISMLIDTVSSVKWEHLMQTGSGFYKVLTTLRLLKTTKITISQKTPFFKITKK